MVGVGLGVAMVARGGPREIWWTSVSGAGLGISYGVLILYEFRQIALALTPIARPVLLRPVFVL